MHRMTMACAFAALLLFSAPLSAQQDDEAPRFTPVDIFVCTFHERKSMRDLDRVIEEWARYMQTAPDNGYSAVTLTPYYYSQDVDFDILWLGWSPDGTRMGAGTDHWLANGGAIAQKFADVVECGAHANFAAVNIKPPPDGPVPQRGVLSFSDCVVHDGVAMGDAIGAMSDWAKHETDSGIDNGTWAYFPIFGAGDTDYDFKRVEAFRDFSTFGRIYDWWGNGGAFRDAQDMLDPLMTCDSPRVYTMRLRRDGTGTN